MAIYDGLLWLNVAWPVYPDHYADGGLAMGRVADLVGLEVYDELGHLAADYVAESRRHTGPIRLELDRAAAQLRFVRSLYFQGSVTVLAALDWLECARTMLAAIQEHLAPDPAAPLSWRSDSAPDPDRPELRHVPRTRGGRVI